MDRSTHVRLLDASRGDGDDPIDKLAYEVTLAGRLRPGDLVLCVAGECVPADAVVVEGSARLAAGDDDGVRALTGPSLRVESGCRIISGHLVLRISA